MFKKNPNLSTKILSIETSGRNFSLTLSEGNIKLSQLSHLGELSFNIGYRHSSILKESCQFLLKKAGWKIDELTHIAISTGPGSFTGLRVGISFTRALASALHIPLIGVPTFELIAKRFEHYKNSPLTVLIDSIGEDLFVGTFKAGKITPSQPYKVVKLTELLKKVPNQNHLYVGEGFLRYEKEICRKNRDGALFVEQIGLRPYFSRTCPNSHTPRSKELAEIAFQKIKTQPFSKNEWKKVVPFYLRLPLVVERLKK